MQQITPSCSKLVVEDLQCSVCETAFANAPGGTYPNNNGNPPYNNNPNSNVSATSQKIYAIGGDGEPKTGLSTVLRVMSGDDVSIFAKSFMSQADANDAGNGYPITDFFTNFILGLTGVGPVAASGHGNEAFQFLNNTPALRRLVKTLESSPYVCDYGGK